MKKWLVVVNHGGTEHRLQREGTYDQVRAWVTGRFPQSAIWHIEPKE